jgi:hypothetical protein
MSVRQQQFRSLNPLEIIKLVLSNCSEEMNFESEFLLGQEHTDLTAHPGKVLALQTSKEQLQLWP